MNFKAIIVSLFAITFSGCVKVNMPEHMVTDVVDVGKDLYHSVASAFEKNPKLGELESNAAGSEFWLANAGTPETSVGELKRTCLSTLVSKTREKVGVENLEYKVVDQRVEAKDASVVVRCQIAVVTHSPDPGA